VAASGKGVGVITSVGVNHATPASFYAHAEDRNDYENIILQYIASDVDFAAGGGILTKRGSGNDAAYFEQKAEDAGIKVYHGKNEWSKMSKSDKRVLCLSGKTEGELPYAINRKADDTTLSDFVSAGISYLESKFAKKGFFMMVEGGRIDNAGHADDGATCFQEVNDFAAAIDVVLAFYEKHPDETLIVVTADHETGGLMLGAGRYEMKPELLKAQKMSTDMLSRLFGETFKKENNPTWEEAKAFFTEHLGLWGDVAVDRRTEQELKAIFDRNYGKTDSTEERVVNMYSSSSLMVQQAVGYLNKAAGYGWSYGSHSGSPVGLYVKGKAAEAFLPARDNTDIAPIIAKVAGYSNK
jgi:alkaline phosphatase